MNNINHFLSSPYFKPKSDNRTGDTSLHLHETARTHSRLSKEAQVPMEISQGIIRSANNHQMHDKGQFPQIYQAPEPTLYDD